MYYSRIGRIPPSCSGTPSIGRGADHSLAALPNLALVPVSGRAITPTMERLIEPLGQGSRRSISGVEWAFCRRGSRPIEHP